MSEPRMAKEGDRACSSPTLLQVARATKKRAFLERSTKGKESKGSRAFRCSKTFRRSQEGVGRRRGTAMFAARMTSLRTLSVPTEGREFRKTRENIDRVPLSVDTEAPLSCQRKTRNSAILDKEGNDGSNPFAKHQDLYEDQRRP